MINLKQAALAAGTVVLLASPSQAMPLGAVNAPELPLTTAAGGCGPNAWRGPWGHCRNTPYYGRLPNGFYQTRVGNGCPPGYWRGPWGHCRNTPYHGRLPGGGWK